MPNIIFFDTETTGNTEKDFICQLAYKFYPEGEDRHEVFSCLYKPPLRVPPEASAVHHITNSMLLDKAPFCESPDFKKIKNLFEDENSIVIAHNAPFDLMMLKKEGIVPKKYICTLRVIRDLDEGGKIEKYNLQYLRYLLELDVEASAHDAMGDVLVLEKLYEKLKNDMGEKFLGEDEDSLIERMQEISSHPSILKSINFGKHSGKKLEEIIKTDRGYLEWLLQQKEASGQLEEDWIYTLKHFLNKR